MGDATTSAIHPPEPAWLGAMMREIATAHDKRMPMRWPCRLAPTGEPDRQELRRGLNEMFAHFEKQPFRGPRLALPQTPDADDSGLPDADEIIDLVGNFEALMDIAMHRGWTVELAVTYDELGRSLYHVMSAPAVPTGPFTPLMIVRYYLVDAIAHALVELQRYPSA